MKTHDCVLILEDCLGSLEQQVNEIIDLDRKSNKSQTKGEITLQEQEVNKALSFTGEKFDGYEQERRKKEK